jgi:hypothetical protein
LADLVTEDLVLKPVLGFFFAASLLKAFAVYDHGRMVVILESGVARDDHLVESVRREESVADRILESDEHDLGSSWIELLGLQLEWRHDERCASEGVQRMQVGDDALAREALERSGSVVVHLESIVQDCGECDGFAPQLLGRFSCDDHGASLSDERAVHALCVAVELRSVRWSLRGLDAELLVEVQEVTGEELASSIRVHLSWIHSELSVKLLDELFDLARGHVLTLDGNRIDEVAVLVDSNEHVECAAE